MIAWSIPFRWCCIFGVKMHPQMLVKRLGGSSNIRAVCCCLFRVSKSFIKQCDGNSFRFRFFAPLSFANYQRRVITERPHIRTFHCRLRCAERFISRLFISLSISLIIIYLLYRWACGEITNRREKGRKLYVSFLPIINTIEMKHAHQGFVHRG